MKAEELPVVPSPIIQARKKTGLSPSQLTARVSEPVRTLLATASPNPNAMLAVAGK